MTKEIYRADHVGSLLRPAELKEARRQFENNDITIEDLRAVEDKAIANAVQKQKRSGIKSSY